MRMDNPLVTVIVLSYNHSKFVQEAVKSVVEQNYENIEIIAVDDASIDGSGDALNSLGQQFGFPVFCNQRNVGNCRSFNTALKKARGKYIIDLAADDMLLPERVRRGVEIFKNSAEQVGVHFCDAEIIDENGVFLRTHYRRDGNGHLAEKVPQGQIFKDLLARYFICTTSMMIKKTVLDNLGGYDENLSYEDFDFWVRSSRSFNYVFTDEILVKKRIVKKSHSRAQKNILNKHIASTRMVCQKAFNLCHSKEEFEALLQRIKYERKWALATGNVTEFLAFQRLKAKVKNRIDL